MGITAATLSSYAVNETLGDQAQQSGNNQIVLSDDIQAIVGNNGQVTGTDYIGRVIIVNLGGTEQTRLVIADAAGTGNTRILTVGEDWTTNPVSTDTVHVFYNMGDLDAITSYYNTRTGFYEMSNPIIVGNGTDPAGLWIGNGELVEIEDSKSASIYSLEVQNAGRLQVGYLQGGNPVAGAYLTGINNSQGETWTIFESGAQGRLYDARFIASLNPLQFNTVASVASDVQAENFSIFQGTDEGLFFDSSWKKGSIVGASTATEIVRVNAGTVFSIVALINTDGLQTAAGDTTTESLTLNDVTFIGNTNLITLNSNKTWNMINPIWDATIYTDFVWTTSTLNYVYDKRSIDAIVQKADGTLLQNALVNIYENTQLADLVLELTTDVNGVVSDAFTYRFHETNSATTTYGGHALQAGKWLYEPFVATQSSTDKFDGTIVLSPDSNIVQTTQATAKSAGSGVTWNEDTNPSELFDFTLGAGSLAVGMILTFAPSGAVGTITQSLDGDSVAGTLHLETRNGTAIANGDTFSRTGGTAGTFSGTYTNDTTQKFSIHIDASTLAYQGTYDYLAAIQNETPLTADGELIWEWCRSAQTQPLYASGSSFHTEQSNSKGVIVLNGGVGVVDYFTDDSGVQWTPPSTVTLEITVKDKITLAAIQNVQTSIHLKDSPFTELMNEDTTVLGVASEAYSGSLPIDVVWKCRKSDDLDSPRYRGDSGITTIGTEGLNLTVLLEENPVLN